jgi:hypothetical protein
VIRIYLDEAGISKPEPVSVVAAIAVDDPLAHQATEALRRLVKKVPEQFRSGALHFHATDIWNGHNYNGVWPLADRIDLLYSLMSMPRLRSIPLCAGFVRRDLAVPNLVKGLTPEQAHHMICFCIAIGNADFVIRQLCGPSETGVVIAEDTPKMRKWLQKCLDFLKSDTLVLGTPDEPIQRVERIFEPIQFADKTAEPLLSLADACAFAMRRGVAKLSHGEEFFRSVTASDVGSMEKSYSSYIGYRSPVPIPANYKHGHPLGTS